MEINHIDKVFQIRDYDESRQIATFVGEPEKSDPAPSLEFLKDNGLLNHEPGALMFFDDGSMVTMRSIPDFGEFVTFLLQKEPSLAHGFYVDDESNFVKLNFGMVGSIYLVPDSKILDLAHHPVFKSMSLS